MASDEAVERVARMMANKAREMEDELPMTDDEWHRLNPWEAESLDAAARAAIAALAQMVGEG